MGFNRDHKLFGQWIADKNLLKQIKWKEGKGYTIHVLETIETITFPIRLFLSLCDKNQFSIPTLHKNADQTKNLK